MTKDKQSPVIRQLSENINRLNALDFDSGYAAGYDAGVKYIRAQIAQKFDAKASETYYDEKEIWLEAVEIVKGESSD